MLKDIDTIRAYFRRDSSEIYIRIMNTFQYNAQKLNRQIDENVFQQLSSRYTEELKSELKQAAEQLLEQYKGGVNGDLLRLDFSNQISYTLTEFKLKIRSM